MPGAQIGIDDDDKRLLDWADIVKYPYGSDPSERA
jgi:hypothetical protein